MIIVNYARKEQTAAIKDLMITANSDAYSRYWGIECLTHLAASVELHF
jgi:hypothetical protein